MRRLPLAALLSLPLLLSALPARADAIDGEWCNADGLRLVIEGRTITTPGGSKAEGAYGRHVFSYRAPAGDPDAGADVRLTLMNEVTVHHTSNASPAMQVWRKCKHVS